MSYDFTTVLDRSGKDCIAADYIPLRGAEVREGFDRIPMWVADMSFPVAPPILEAMRRRLDYPFLGYFPLPERWYEAIIRWQSGRNGVVGLEKEHIGYENGVLGGVSSAIQMLTAPGESVLLHAPTYVGFTHVLKNIGREAVHSELVPDENGVWRMDYDDMDRKLRENRIHLAVFCSPHNPTGRVWERREIERAMEVYAANDCLVISDEIWSDIILPGNRHVPTQTVSEDARRRTIAFYSPSKSFSLAGLIGSYHIVYDARLRDRLKRQGELTHYDNPNVLSVHGMTAAYEQGAEWLEELCAVVDANAARACEALRAMAPGLRVMRPQGTYMLFVETGAWCARHGVEPLELLRRGIEVGVIWQNGEDFIWPASIRLNLALPASRLETALERLREHVFVESGRNV
ncbi:MAG: aminotransferase class I/II-fold pyridoxal phosphate-dependent enzyme [Oscillospiraceae bacterium]|nr:aminotransferase class I/II-fold pyridoxal phosphate-dependent enzyme [Oscillospiraceae bacterium]